jgi:hypothetical protein
VGYSYNLDNDQNSHDEKQFLLH